MKVNFYRPERDANNRAYWSVTITIRRRVFDFYRHEMPNGGMRPWTRKTSYSFALHTRHHVTCVSWCRLPSYAP